MNFINYKSLTKSFPKILLFLAISTLALVPSLHTSAQEGLGGQFSNIPAESILEGSVKMNGIQPDYYIDTDNKLFDPLRSFSTEIKNLDIPLWEKIDRIQNYIKTETFHHRDYENPYYRKILKKYRIRKEPIPLSEYLRVKAGVCREYALITHFALKWAGIENEFVYANIRRQSNLFQYDITEDHAFNVIKHVDEKWVVDSYYWGFNGFKLDDLLSLGGISRRSLHAPIATPSPGFRKINHINSFPKMLFTPQIVPSADASCPDMMKSFIQN